MNDRLSDDEKQALLKLARGALESGVRAGVIPPVDLKLVSHHLREPGVAFVTLTKNGQLRGCIGALEPYQPLAQDVREHAVAAALEDPRFPPVKEREVERIGGTRPLKLDFRVIAATNRDIKAMLARGELARSVLPTEYLSTQDSATSSDQN